MKRLFHILLFIIECTSICKAQSWNQLETEYNTLSNSKQNDLALNKAKEINSWALLNEGDSSLKYAVSLRYIGNCLKSDSAILFYNLSLQVLEKKNRLNCVEALYCYNNIAITYLSKNEFKLAIFFYEKALSLRKLIYGEENTEYADNLFNLATSYDEIGDYQKSEAYHKLALETRKRILGEEHPDYANSLNNIGHLYFVMNDFLKAEQYFKQALDIRKRILGVNNLDYLTSVSNLGLLHYTNKNFKDAESYLLSALQINKKLLGDNHPDISTSLYRLGKLYIEMRNYKLAEDYLLKSLDLDKIIFGVNHPVYASSLINLGVFYMDIRDFKKAELFYNKSIDIYKYINYKEHEDYAICLMNLGTSYYYEGDFDNANKYLNESLFIFKNTVGQNHIYTAKCLDNLGLLHSDLEKFKSAEVYYKESLNIYKKISGNEDLNLVSILNNLGSLYYESGDYFLAESYFLNAIQICKKSNAINNLDYAMNLNNLGILYFKIGYNIKAETYFKEAFDIFQTSNSKKDINYLMLMNNLAILNCKLNKYGDAEYFFINIIENGKKTIGVKNPFYANSILSYGNYNFEIGNYSEAKKNYRKALYITKKFHGVNNLNYCLILQNLGILNCEIRDYKKAKYFLLKSFETKKKYLGKIDIYLESNLIDLGKLFFVLNNYEKSFEYYKNAFSIKLKHVKDNFNWLSFDEKTVYWENQNIFLNTLNSFLNINSIVPLSTSLSYNVCLISKSLLIHESNELEKSIANNSEDSIKSKFLEMKAFRRLYSKMKSEGSDKTLLMDLYEKRADSLDKILVRKVGEYSRYNRNLELNWIDVQSSIFYDEASIEFVDYFDKKDSCTYYMGLVVKVGDKYPQLVKLCSEKELKQFSPEKELKEIYDLVWKPLLPALSNVKTIYYSPTGLLNNIPFQALYKEENGQREYVMDKFTLHQLTSTRYLALDLKKKEQETIEPSIALFGGINYNDYPNPIIDSSAIDESSEAAFLYKNAIVVNRDIDSTRTGASYLPCTKKEVETISDILNAKQWQVDISEGKNATENKIKSFSGNNSKAILHIATHGFAYPDKEEKRKDLAFSMMSGNEKYKVSDNPMIRCGLLFGGANMTWQGKGDSLLNTTNEDGVLTAYELSQLDLSNTKLAVLSACETGKGAIQGSEGTFGLKRALKLAGVDNMIVSLWKVPDDATMEMMTLFYTELANTKKPVSSFETAQKAMRLKYPNEPEKWAGFVFVR